MNKKIKGIIITSTLMLQAGYAQAGLIISEYVEGSANNKALELFNTGEAIDFGSAGYVLDIYYNSKTSPATINLTGSVNAGATFVITHTGASAELALLADQASGSLRFNGNDSIVLRQADVIVDSFGQAGTGLSQGWGVDNFSTYNNTLRREAGVSTGDLDVLDIFDPALQWTGFGRDDYSGLGQHTLLAANWQGASSQTGSVNVPEPGTVLLLLIGLAGLLFSGSGKAVTGLDRQFTLLRSQGV